MCHVLKMKTSTIIIIIIIIIIYSSNGMYKVTILY